MKRREHRKPRRKSRGAAAGIVRHRSEPAAARAAPVAELEPVGLLGGASCTPVIMRKHRAGP